MKLITPLLLLILVLVLAMLVVPGTVASTDDSVHGYITGRVTTTHDVDMTDIEVILVNASNTTEEIPGFNATCDQLGFYQFSGVPAGTYNVFAWGPHLSAGMSNNVTVVDNVTYWSAIVLVPQPYYGNMTVSRNPIPLEGAKTGITITVYDFWEEPVGPGWMISVHTTAGTLDPLYGLTDANSQFKTTLTSPDTGSYAEVTEHVRGWNGTYYPLQKRITVVNATPTPTPNPSPTAQPSATPAATPNATATPAPSVTPTAGPTAAPNATAIPTATATPTPGFEILLATLAFGAAAIVFRKK